MLDGVIQPIRNVKIVPNLRQNFLHLRSFDEKGYKFSSKGGVIRVFKSDM